MPELPEVELYRREFESLALHKKVIEVEAENEGRMIPAGFEKLREEVLDKSFVGTERVGKYLFVKLSSGSYLLWHFALTGSFTYYQDEEMKHRFARILFRFDNGWTLSFNSMRKFSRLELVENIPSYQKKKKLGLDARLISKEDFATSLSKKGTQIKPALLEQKHFAGVGNWIADEMLHWVQIHPETRCKEISTEQYYQLHAALQEIIQVALDYGGDYGSFPPRFMVKVREDGGNCPRCEGELTRLVVGGRGTYICSSCQAAPELES